MGDKMIFKQYYAMGTIALEIITKSPLLIKSGDDEYSPSSKDMRFIRNSAGEIIIPGSSLKGFFRGNLERVIPDNKMAGYIEDLFGKIGNETQASRIFFDEFHLKKGQDLGLESRPQIAIDRKTLGVKKGALFFLEAVSADTIFEGSIKLRNWKLEHFGLCSFIFNIANLGLIRLGFNKTRGFGEVQIKPKSVSLLIIGGSSNNYVKISNKNGKLEIHEIDGKKSIFLERSLECSYTSLGAYVDIKDKDLLTQFFKKCEDLLEI